MAKSCNQKGKILYLQKMLSETTSQNPVTMQEILAKLEEQGIRAERKSIYDDMETCVILEWIYITEEDGKEDIMRKNPLQIKQKWIIR